MLRKDARSYANRLSKQMDKIANVGIKIEKYFHDSYQKCTNLEFTEDAIKTFRGVERLPGSDAIEVYRDVDRHIEAFHVFLDRWKISRDVDKKTMKLGKSMQNEFLKLRDYIEDTPPELVTDVQNIIMQKRLGGF
ncbi:MAG: hypothetical protein PVG41_07230 [Desulfobacteraceae bacterium]